VAEDHKTHNAMALVNRGAALLVRDADSQGERIGTAMELIRDDARRASLSENIKKLAIRNSDEVIAREVLKLARR